MDPVVPFTSFFFRTLQLGYGMGSTRRSEGHDLDLGQHVLQAGRRADGTATDGATFGETVTNVGRVWRI